MTANNRQKGFSLLEVVLAAGIFTIGFMLIASVMPVAVKLTAVATERTISSVVRDEAIAKVKLYGIDPVAIGSSNCVLYDENVLPLDVAAFFDVGEFAYPSTDTGENKKYYWSALCIDADPGVAAKVIFFICRRADAATYRDENYVYNPNIKWPIPVALSVNFDSGDPANFRKLTVTDDSAFPEGCAIVDDSSGSIYHVLSRNADPGVNEIELTEGWQGGYSGIVWVVPPAESSGRNPCVLVDASNVISY